MNRQRNIKKINSLINKLNTHEELANELKKLFPKCRKHNFNKNSYYMNFKGFYMEYGRIYKLYKTYMTTNHYTDRNSKDYVLIAKSKDPNKILELIKCLKEMNE